MKAGKKTGNLFVVSAPSGAGKTSLCRMLCERIAGIEHSVSYTTREPREGEKNDVDYTFIDKQGFLEMADKGEFLEWAEVHGNSYGTSTTRINETKSGGIDVIMDIDTQGARQLMNKDIDAIFIFVLPPSLDELQSRLEGRNTDSGKVISKRLLRARDEIRDYNKYEYVIINDVLESALDDLMAIVRAGRCRQVNIDNTWIEERFFKGG